MNKTLSGMKPLNDSPALLHSLRAVWTLRLALGFIVLLGSIIFFLGTSWDIQWHSLIGRDRTLIPPHEVMLTGVGLSGLAAVTAVLIETLWARRNPIIAQSSTSFADAFHGSLGAYVAGFAALDAAVAFPLDAYWHSLYGIDVTIWAPFHLMIIVGMAMVALGAAYMLASAARLAASAKAVGPTRLGYVGVIVAFASMMSIFTFLVFTALNVPGPGNINLDVMTINVFPLLVALLGAGTFVSVVYAVPWKWAATSVAVASLVLVVIVALYVPAATDLLVKLEHQTYRAGNPGFALIAFEWPLMPLLAAILIDIAAQLARRKRWSLSRRIVVMALLSLVVCVPVLPIFPLLSLDLLHETGTLGSGISLLLGLLSAGVGAWFGHQVGTSLQYVERGA